jgi:hypothetical protein
MIGAEDVGQSSGKLENPIPLRVTKVGMSVCVLRSVADAKLRPKKINLAFTSARTPFPRVEKCSITMAGWRCEAFPDKTLSEM